MELLRGKDKVDIVFLFADLHNNQMGIGMVLDLVSHTCLSSFHHLLFRILEHIPKLKSNFLKMTSIQKLSFHFPTSQDRPVYP